MAKIKGFQDTIEWYESNAKKYAQAIADIASLDLIDRFVQSVDQGGKVLIDFFSVDDLAHIRAMLSKEKQATEVTQPSTATVAPTAPASVNEKQKEEEDLYSINNFTL